MYHASSFWLFMYIGLGIIVCWKDNNSHMSFKYPVTNYLEFLHVVNRIGHFNELCGVLHSTQDMCVLLLQVPAGGGCGYQLDVVTRKV